MKVVHIQSSPLETAKITQLNFGTQQSSILFTALKFTIFRNMKFIIEIGFGQSLYQLYQIDKTQILLIPQLTFIITGMLLYQNKKNHREFFIHSKRLPHRTVSPVKTKAKLLDSPNIPHDKMRPFDTIELRCEGVKLKTRDFRVPQSVKRKISQGISQTVPLLKPILSLVTPPVFSSLELKQNTFLRGGKPNNPEESKPVEEVKIIPSQQIILYNNTKSNELKQGEGFYMRTNRYVGLHACQTVVVPKVKGVLEDFGVVVLENNKKYHVSAPYLGYSFRNLIGQFGKFEDSTAKYFLKQLISTVISLHELGISHNRLNMDSILHDCEGNLLINFFKAKSSPITQAQRQQYLHYFCPQVLISKNGHRSFKNDIWAIGVITLQFLSNKLIKNSKHHPYNQTSLSKSTMISSFLAKKISENNTNPQELFEESLSNQAIDFINTCLQVNQRKRPTARQLLSHPYLDD